TAFTSAPAKLAEPELPERPPARPEVVQNHILAPPLEEEAKSIQVPRDLPNIFPPPPQKELPDELELRVLIVAPDDITTGDLSPDGATVMAYRSNVPAIAEFTFQHQDKQFPKRAQARGGGLPRPRPYLGAGLGPRARGARAGAARRPRRHREELRADSPPQPHRAGDRPAPVQERGRLRQGAARPALAHLG